MLRHVFCGSSLRAAVIVVSGVLALAGWAGAGAAWLHFGVEAGIRPSFIAALSVGICFTIVHAQALITPGHANVYGIGWRDGMAAAQHGERAEQSRRHLSSV